MRNPGRSLVLTLLGVALPFAGICRLQVQLDSEISRLHSEEDELVLRSGRLIKALGLEYDGLLADIYWTRAVQYYGEKHRKHDSNYESLWPLLDVTTELDPHLLVAYHFGTIFLSEPAPRGAGRPDLAEVLIRRGISQNPDYWRFWADLGFLYYWDMKDYARASAAFLEGSKQPNAAIWMKVLAAKVAEEGRSVEVSMFLWQEIYESSQDPAIRKNALEHMQVLKAEEDAKHLEQLAADFHKQFGRYPESVGELVRAGLLLGRPVDPAGFPYVLGPEGKVHLNLQSPIRSDILKPIPRP